jgi:hypothetical protein
MKQNVLIIFLMIFSASLIFPQGKEYKFKSFSLEIIDSTLYEWGPDSTIIYSKKFYNPQDIAVDLDGDGIDEYIVDDSYTKYQKNYYWLYIFHTADSLYLADSINSGITEPYVTHSDEVQRMIIISGNPVFDSLNTDTSNIFLPINCWKYDNGRLYSVNDEVYNLFITENNDIIDFLDNYFSSNKTDCTNSDKVKAAIAAAYVNYLNAGEFTLASQFLKRYYLCTDIEKFKKYLAAQAK